MGTLRSLRKLVFGETWAIPLGVAAALLVALAGRAALPDEVWTRIGGFVLAGMVALTLGLALRLSR